MATEESVVRARIAALRSLLEAQERRDTSISTRGYHSSQYRHTGYSRTLGQQQFSKSRNSNQANSTSSSENSSKRPTTGANTLSLEDGRYRKTRRGFSLRREDTLPKSAIEVSAEIAAKQVATKSIPKSSPHASIPPPTTKPTQPPNVHRNVVSTRTEYCLFFNKFGECKKKHACPYVHDSRKVAICRGFIRGTCTDGSCKLSHQIDQNKMPDCAMFLKGMCTREGCIFRHVNVSRDAGTCEAFSKGYCAHGAQCHLKHEFPRSQRNSRPQNAPADIPSHPAPMIFEEVHGDAVIDSPPALNIRPTIRFTPKVV